MIDPKQVTAVIVTRGDIDLALIRESLAVFPMTMVWDNSQRERDMKVFGRYLMADAAPTEYVYVQDDDCIIDAKRLAAMYDPESGELLCNVKPSHRGSYQCHYPGIMLVGWGSIFPRAMIDFGSYLGKYPADELFYRECDRVFTFLNRGKIRVVDIGVRDLPHAGELDRMGTEARHGADLMEIRRRLQTL